MASGSYFNTVVRTAWSYQLLLQALYLILTCRSNKVYASTFLTHPKAVFVPNQHEKWSGQDNGRKQGISYVCQASTVGL